MNTTLLIIIIAIAALNIFKAGQDYADSHGAKEVIINLSIAFVFGFLFIILPLLSTVIGFIYRNSIGRLVALISWSDFGFWMKISVFKMYRNKDKIKFNHLERLKAAALDPKKAHKMAWYKKKYVKLIDKIFEIHNYVPEPVDSENEYQKTVFD